jgi:hypothetical protein
VYADAGGRRREEKSGKEGGDGMVPRTGACGGGLGRTVTAARGHGERSGDGDESETLEVNPTVKEGRWVNPKLLSVLNF